VVLDVSLSGLLLETTLVLEQGDDVAIEIESGVRIKALAWHSRRMRRGGKECLAAGMMLSEVGPDYEALVARIAGQQPTPRLPPQPAPRPELKQETAPAPPRPAPPPLPSARSSWWRLRIKQVDGPRTRVVTLAAESREQAIEQSLAEIGAGWEILEAVAR
jgi:hypothetical protein